MTRASISEELHWVSHSLEEICGVSKYPNSLLSSVYIRKSLTELKETGIFIFIFLKCDDPQLCVVLNIERAERFGGGQRFV